MAFFGIGSAPQRPQDDRSTGDRVIDAIGALGAGFSGNINEFNRNRLLEQQTQIQSVNAAREALLRDTALATRQARGFLETGDVEPAQRVLFNAAQQVSEFGFPVDDVGEVLDLLRQGTPESIAQAKRLVEETDQAAVAGGFIEPDDRFDEPSVGDRLRERQLGIEEAKLAIRQTESALREQAFELEQPENQAAITLAKESAKAGIKRLNENLPQIRKALNNVRNSDRRIALIERGIRSGSLAETRNNIARAFGTFLGVEDDKVSATEEFLALGASSVADFIQNLGSGTGLSDNDLKFAEFVTAGDISFTEDALKELVKLQRNGAIQEIQEYNADLQALRDIADPKTLKTLPRPIDLRGIEIIPTDTDRFVAEVEQRRKAAGQGSVGQPPQQVPAGPQTGSVVPTAPVSGDINDIIRRNLPNANNQ